MSRSFYVGEGVKPEDLHAKYEDGILQVTVPKEAPKAVPASHLHRDRMRSAETVV